ncbi:PAS domain S-box protein [Aquabacterium sp. A7-Y]|uniref:PAS domain S-box protein n=1 Tax=Aquabacterium sp. A7-Y TaxID=1349605 RepID=UPI00223CA3F0|nr:PAS domain S-box protein [Aquabacterium sp. A7-Y]MCW7537753.1 PAS domain S-box protein [Aquabacterium sp. A7-Y]
MTDAALPADEAQRLATLRELRILDTGPEACFDTAVRLAAQVADCPVALLTLVDAERQWFKATHGTSLRETPRAQSCCARTILSDAPLVLEDLREDERFAANPFVTGAPRLRAYAGVPVSVEGRRIGTVSVLDTHARRFDAGVIGHLADIARLVSEMLESRLKEQRWRLQEARVRTASRAGSDWLWETDADGCIRWASASIEARTGQKAEEEVGRPASEILIPRSDPDHQASYQAYLQARARHEPFSNLIADRKTPAGLVTVSISGLPVFDSAGHFRGYRGATRVVTEEIQAQRSARDAQQLREAQLRDSEARTAAVLQALPDLWFVLDDQGRYLECGVTERQQHLLSVEDARGRKLDEALPAAVARLHQAALQRALDTGLLQRVEYELTPLDGTLRTFEGRFMPMSERQVLLLVRDLTELRAMERDLQIMQRAIEAEASLPMTVVDALAPGQPLIYVNPAFERLTGYRREEILGRNCRLLQGSDTDQPGLQQLRAALRAGHSSTVVLNNYRKDGSRFINELHVAPVQDTHGRITHFIGVQTDITQRSIAADRLRLSEELYRSVALSISDGLMVVTSASFVVAVNPAACRILDASMDELVMAPGLDLLTESLHPLPPSQHPVTMALQSGETVTERVFGLRRRDGQLRWLGVSAQPLRVAPNDKPMSAVVTFRDITRQREAEQALSLSEQRWKFALEGSGDGVWDWDVSSDRVYFSRRWKEILGYAEHELGDAPHEWSSRLHPDDLPTVLEKLELHMKDSTPVYQSEHRIRHRDGRWLWVFERGKVVQRNEQGRALRIVGTYSDITRLKSAERALRDKQAVELASRAKTEFLSRMSHEMRTPLNAMIGFSQLLKFGAAEAPASQVRHYADHMLQAGQHLLALINDVLDLQRVEAGQMSISIEPTSLRKTLAQTLELLEPLALSAAVNFDNQVEEDVTVLVDSQRLRQVLINIISNAVKYNRPDGVVRLSLGDRQGDAIDIRVEDSGEGLRPDQLARLFQPFERLGRETSPIEGTGLGLIIAKRLLEEMGGSIEVSSEPGTGTCVTLMVPLAGPASAGPPADTPAPAEQAQMPEEGIDHVRMLYVEDNPINALLFEEAMKLTGYIDLMIAEDGPQAFELVRDFRPDVLVLDAHLPGMSGFDVLRELRARHGLADVPAFMCSADAMPEDIQRAMDAGFLGYWTKPIEVAKVIAEIERACPRRPRGG